MTSGSIQHTFTSTTNLTSRSAHLMGATITISISHGEADRLLDDVFLLLHLYEKRFSANDETSELMQVNKAAGKNPVSVHPDLFELIKLGKKHSLASQSHLNIAIGPLVKAWRIGFFDARVPSSEEIEQALLLTDPSCIELDSKTSSVYLTKTGMSLDLGALAKGYIADRIAEFLHGEEVTSALINLGGNILTIGINEQTHRPWRIGIQHPRLPRGTNVAVLPIKNQSVVTSGIYERKLQANGKTYHHILDRDTGYPIDTQLTSLTVVSNQSIDGEIWTTRLFGESPNSILEQVEKETGIDALVITKNNHIRYSSGLIPEFLF